MIKKLLSFAGIFAICSTVSAQNFIKAEPAVTISKRQLDVAQENLLSAKTASTLVTDTLWYVFNKHYYRNLPAQSLSFSSLKNPYPSTLTISHAGSHFLNSGSLTVGGLEAAVVRHGTSTSPTITVRLYLCNVTAGQPVFPALDSVNATATGTAVAFVGGNFTVPKTVTGDYAVLAKCVSPGDTMRILMNNAATATSTVPVNQRYGEGIGHLRVMGSFVATTNSFGTGTDYEFLVAPRVAFALNTAETSPATNPYCTATPYTFNNASSAWLTHRMYNLNQFAKTWAPFSNTVTINADSVLTWSFGDGTGNFYGPTVAHSYAAAGNFSGALTGKYQKMSDAAGQTTVIDQALYTKTVAVCAGIQNVSAIEAISVYPNPSNTGIVNITNLVNDNTIELYNMLGQVVFKDKTSVTNYTADFSNLPKGSYFVKITSSNEKAKLVKLILN